MRLALVNPNTNAETTARMVDILAAHSDANITGLTAPFGAPLITTPAALDEARQAVISLLPRLQDYDAVMVAAFGDPAHDDLAAALPCPVIGIAQAAMIEAAATAPRFAVVTTTPALAGRIGQRAEGLGLGAQYAGCWTTSEDPQTLMADHAILVNALWRTIKRATTECPNIGAIIIGGGPLGQAAIALSTMTDLPVIQPLPAALRLISTHLRKDGL